MDEKAQTSIEYVLLIAAVILFAVIVIVFVNSNIFNPSASQGQKYAQGISNLSGNVSKSAG